MKTNNSKKNTDEKSKQTKTHASRFCTINSAGTVIGMQKNAIFVNIYNTEFYQAGTDACITAFNSNGNKIMDDVCMFQNANYPNLTAYDSS